MGNTDRAKDGDQGSGEGVQMGQSPYRTGKETGDTDTAQHAVNETGDGDHRGRGSRRGVTELKHDAKRRRQSWGPGQRTRVGHSTRTARTERHGAARRSQRGAPGTGPAARTAPGTGTAQPEPEGRRGETAGNGGEVGNGHSRSSWRPPCRRSARLARPAGPSAPAARGPPSSRGREGKGRGDCGLREEEERGGGGRRRRRRRLLALLRR